ncbi:MFS transporter [Saxibacter everestensis]|uniref:MFS transporter n=1 Tax=Saxibacter everestensis TaxID=2909229 RepID=A0ABY8QRT9_9MICO|nr:MFS transporter [Brevibacteriaceae bacterium ZFBP1038]
MNAAEPPPTGDTGVEPPDPRRWRLLAVFMATVFMALLGVSIVNVALPSIESSLQASSSQLQWILAGYALTFGLVLVGAGRLGDIFGRGPLFLIGVTIFVLSSLACGLAPDAMTLNIARGFQGVSAGLINPQTVGMIQETFRGRERGTAYGILGAVVGVATAIGPPLGGVILATAGAEVGWRWIFFINVPIGIATFIAALVLFPRPLVRRERDAGSKDSLPAGSQAGGRRRPNRDLDPTGMLLLGLATLGVMLPFVERQSPIGLWIWATLPVAGVLGFLFVRWERRYKERGRTPMIDLAIFRIRSYSLGAALSSAYFAGMTSIWVLISLFMQSGLGESALAAGLIGLPSAIASGIMSTIASRRAFDYGRRLVVLGTAIALIALVATIVVGLLTTQGVSVWWWLLTLGVLGAGGGMVIAPNQTLTLADVPNQYAGSAGGAMQTGQRVGTSIGLAVITAVTFAALGTGPGAVDRWPFAFAMGMLMVIGFITLALLIGLSDTRSRRT